MRQTVHIMQKDTEKRPALITAFKSFRRWADKAASMSGNQSFCHTITACT